MEKETEFESKLSKASASLTIINLYVANARDDLKKERIIDVLESLKYVSRYVDSLHDFLLKYNNFFQMLDRKFGTQAMECSESSKKITVDMKKEAGQINVLVSQRKFKIAEEVLKSLDAHGASLVKNFEGIIPLPHVIDYSKLSNKDWRMIGVAGIHYRPKVFLSYCFRDTDPKKDENQRFIDNYVKPTCELLNIEPVTARGHLKPQELIDDKVIELVENCDGIIGFYTKDDSVGNVEHELSRNDNIVAICREGGARAPSMRLSRLLIDFKRDEMGNFLIELIGILKDRGLFRTMV